MSQQDVMTDEIFWKRIEEEVVPHVKEKHAKSERFINDKIVETKNLDFDKNYEIAYHQWMVLACLLRDYYYEGLQIKSLIEHCVIKCGESPDSIGY